MLTTVLETLKDAQKIVIIQAENPDGDSLGSSLALEELLSEAGKFNRRSNSLGFATFSSRTP